MSNPTRRDGRPKRPPPFAQQMRRALSSVPARHMSTAHRATLIVLATYARSDGSDCFPALKTLQADLGMGERKLLQVLNELEHARRIKREHRADEGGRQTSTLYHLYLTGAPVLVSRRRTVRGLKEEPASAADLESQGVIDLASRRARTPKLAPRRS